MILFVGIEGRIEAGQVDAGITEVCHVFEAVAVVEGVWLELDVHVFITYAHGNILFSFAISTLVPNAA